MRKTRSLSLNPEKKSFLQRYPAYARCIVTNLDLFVLALFSQLRQFFSSGTADPADIKKGREKAKENLSKASIAKIHPDAGLFEIQEALKKTIADIDGFAFLKKSGEHTILIKIGVNWGFGGYPTITSPESIYAVTRLCLEEAEKIGKRIKVIIGDESGIEVKRMRGKNGEKVKNLTRKNFEDTGVLAAARWAALHHAEAQEKKGRAEFKGAGKFVEEMAGRHGFDVEQFRTKWKETARKVEAEGMAEKVGVKVLPFDTEDETKPEKVEVCYPDSPPDMVKYFKKGFLIPKVVAEEVTDIINLPKPPGRHSILGNEGLSGALKNYVGLMDGDERIGRLHGSDPARFFEQKKNQHQDSYSKNFRKAGTDITRIKKDETGIMTRKSSRSAVLNYKFKRAWKVDAFHKKIAEIYLAFADKERFCVTDMRKTISSIGPDFGDNIDIGAVIAASDALTLDAIAGAFLKKRYEEIEGFWEAVKLGGDTPFECWAGKTWLKKGSPFDLKSHIAANSYKLGPIGLDQINFEELETSGFRVSEIEALARWLGAKGIRSGA